MAAKDAKDKERTPGASRYHRRELIANAQSIFGVKPEVVAGALYGVADEHLTVDEVAKRIEDFKKRRVK